MNRQIKYEHPSYATINLNRVHFQGKSLLFGSSSKSSYAVCLTVTEAYLGHDLGADHIFAQSKRPHIEVWMTEEQLGRMLSSMSLGQGVPCTLKELAGKTIPECPPLASEPARIHEEYRAKLDRIRDDLDGHAGRVEAILSKEGAINKADRKAIAEVFDTLRREMVNNSEFALQQFQESAERVVESSKADINTYIAQLAKSAGLPAGSAVSPVLNLETSEEPK